MTERHGRALGYCDEGGHGGAGAAALEPVRPARFAFGRGGYAPWGRGLAAGLAVLAVWAADPALAVDYSLVRWKKTGQCEIVTRLPLWGDHWVRLGDYTSKAEAERALAEMRRTRACPASKSAKRAENPPDKGKKPPVTYRGGRTEDVQNRELPGNGALR